MVARVSDCLLRYAEDPHALEDYQGRDPRWCTGCGGLSILAAVQRLCRDEQLPLEKVVFVSGIGCSSRFPHYMGTYGFHGLHGRALPVAEGVKMRRPDLHVFVNTGDGDCCSIGAAHWMHAVRYNMNMTVLLQDNHIYGLTKKQASPTSPMGLKTNTSPRGAVLEALDPLMATLGMSNLSFVAQVPDWIPDLLYQAIARGFHHRGLAFIRILQRCPEYMPAFYDPWMRDPDRLRVLTHRDGLQLSPAMAATYPHRLEHDPADLIRAREIAADGERIPVGLLYRNASVPCYEDLRRPERVFTPDAITRALEQELERFTVRPAGEKTGAHA